MLPRPRHGGQLAELAALVDGAGKVSVYAGIGARDARDEIMAFCQKVKAPMVHTTRAKEFLEPDNPYNVGVNGILGNRAGVEALESADLVISLGCDFAYTQFYPEAKKIVQIDIDPTHLGRRSAIHMGLVGDAKTTFAALTPMVAAKSDGAHLEEHQKQWKEDQEGYLEEGKESDPSLIHPQFVANMLDKKADDDAIFVSDVGTAMVWMLRHLKANGKRRFLNSLLHGTMASGMPQALGAKLAYPDRQVIAMCGDGGLTMLMGELLTLVQEQIPLKLVVFHNNSFGFVEMEQRVEGLVDHYTSLHNPDFAKLADGYGMASFTVDKTSDFEDALRSAMDHQSPALIHLKLDLRDVSPYAGSAR